jgi:hypothetical protein
MEEALCLAPRHAALLGNVGQDDLLADVAPLDEIAPEEIFDEVVGLAAKRIRRCASSVLGERRMRSKAKGMPTDMPASFKVRWMRSEWPPVPNLAAI